MVIDDFISDAQANELFNKFAEVYKAYPQDFINDAQCPLSLGIYDMWEFVELLVNKIPAIAEAIEEPVFPTYSYARLYKGGDELKKHTDRESCEVSVTLHLGSDGVEWPIWFEKPNGELVSLNLKPGQGALYLGMITPHWREKYEGSDYRQVFLHYVKARGANRMYYFDKRK